MSNLTWLRGLSPNRPLPSSGGGACSQPISSEPQNQLALDSDHRLGVCPRPPSHLSWVTQASWHSAPLSFAVSLPKVDFTTSNVGGFVGWCSCSADLCPLPALP